MTSVQVQPSVTEVAWGKKTLIGAVGVFFLESFGLSCPFTSDVTLIFLVSAADRGDGGQLGQFAPGPQCKGTLKQCRNCSNQIRSSVTS